jgi:predicted nucleic acid-binding protein
MMLVDTSVWVDHFRRPNARLVGLLDDAAVECHPFVIGEIACGRLMRRAEILALLQELPSVSVAGNDEALTFVEHWNLGGAGIGWIDVHLLASAQLTRTTLWTIDRRLARVAGTLGLGAPA